MTVFVLDTNVISDMVSPNPNVTVVNQIAAHRQHTICLCEAVDYEVRRGYLKTGATAKLRVYEERIKSQFQWVAIVEVDWRQAAQFWADAVNKGKQLSDVDLLVAAVATRLGGQVISADDDFDALPVTRTTWRSP
jgi:predicted nucleic acid-binding protein